MPHREVGEDARDQEADRAAPVRPPDEAVVLGRVQPRLQRVERAHVEEQRPRELHDARPTVEAAAAVQRLKQCRRREEERAGEEDGGVDLRADELDEAGKRADEEAGRADGEQHPDPPRRRVGRGRRRSGARRAHADMVGRVVGTRGSKRTPIVVLQPSSRDARRGRKLARATPSRRRLCCERRSHGRCRREERRRGRTRSGGAALHALGARRTRPLRPCRVPAVEPRGLRDRGRPRSRRDPRGPGDHPRPGARPRPLRTHAGLPVHLLPRCGGGDGARPRLDPAGRAPGAAVRRRPPLERRRLRLARASARLRPQRLRRDVARTVRMGPETARCELRDRGPRP